MVPANFIIVLFFIPQALGQLMTLLYWIQVKEYRADRFWVFLKSPDGVNQLALIPVLLKFTLLVAGLYFDVFIYLYFVEVLVLDLYFFWLVTIRNIRKPVFTLRVKRTLLIVFIMFLCVVPLFFIDFRLSLLLSETLIAIGLVPGIYLTGFLVQMALRRESSDAIKKMADIKPTVIAITGSYGKTTTKDFITQILSSEFKVMSSYKNHNTHFGIIRAINKSLQKDHQFLIAEIGAYKSGEIRKVADILQPKIAVITGIEPQHLELFGSFDKLKLAKFELIESLGNSGTAVFNLSNREVMNLVEWCRERFPKTNILTYGSGGNTKLDGAYKIVRKNSHGVDLEILSESKMRLIHTNLLFDNLMENLIGAILVARTLGVSWQNIEKVVGNIQLPEGTLNIIKKNKLTFIDDSYNSTPHGFEAAIKVLSTIKAKRKILITTGIIELGKDSYSIHKHLGELSSFSDIVILRNKQFFSAFGSGMKNKNRLRLISDPKKIVNFLESLNLSDTAILVEGKLPQIISYLKSI